MVKFIGEYRCKIDDKGRLVFPSPFKALMGEEDQRFVIRKSVFSPCLEMYTYAEWERESEELKSRLNLFNRKHDQLWRQYMSNRAIVEPDGKIGRISVPQQMRDLIGATREVVFLGCDHKIEIWAKEQFESQSMSDDEFVALTEEILG